MAEPFLCSRTWLVVVGASATRSAVITAASSAPGRRLSLGTIPTSGISISGSREWSCRSRRPITASDFLRY
ncbi:hypothetical protein Areg01_20050 [Actinoplanes regularis]|nr:hypothetical protein Areg01_20050 [Actinoplanes regularis]